MTSAGRSGHGATVTFGTSSWAESIITLGGLERTREAIESSHLGLALNAEKTFISADLIGTSPMTITFQFDQSSGTFPPITGATETITVTYPLLASESTNATLVFTGFSISEKGADITVNATDLMQGEMQIQPDGLTGPTYSAGS